MIIETPYKKNDTITIKTIGGEEFISRFLEESTSEIIIEKPMSIMATGQGIGLGPFAFTISQNSKIKINKNVILFVHKSDSEIAAQYVQSTSGIQI